ncbi:signal peptide peptidase SppA [Paracrocinitomix mangrovi]|uniref:signal peptide peptidase SppA n=1 Tax=Paracrocinitomix mangrovi TaxID=2862509 RepID=UPI001C8D0957|nr:signal peptide peptidase SppA [Paracrocinitomix mangrovi]UKN00994.1 signal peptide peptidase SppA [Paracrocinitomix mangrovi]
MNMTFWKTFWASLLATVLSGLIVVGIFFLILRATITSFEKIFEAKEFVVEDNSILHMKLDGQIGDYSNAEFDKSTFQINQQFGMMEILDGLKIAKEDDRIKGLFIECDNISTGMATVKEIRDGIEDFKSSGKFVVAYSDNYSTKSYYLSSAADELYVFPSGMINFLGLGAELMFVKGTLEKLDVEMQIIRGSNNKFKSAVEPLMYTEMSEANRKQTQKYLDALWAEILNGVSESRGVDKAQLETIADSVFIRKSGDAVNYNMADGSMYYDEVLDLLESKLDTADGNEMHLVSFSKYASRLVDKERVLKKLDPKNIAVIFAEGDIVEGSVGHGSIGGTSTSKMIREAREDEDIKAIVLRVNSPGGSALASDIIWREVVLTKEAGKPIVVSMGNLAASGGYYISCAADKIYAQPNTITGSIGVFGIIPYTGKMFENKFGVTFDRVQTNEHSVLSLNKKLSEAELKIVQGEVDDIYDDFITKVAEGRGMTKEMVDSIGQGRVWAGSDAIELGLVDEFGGIYDAIEYAAGEANIATDEIEIQFYPKKDKEDLLNFLHQMEDLDNASITEKSALETQVREIYSYLTAIGAKKSIQAKMPYLLWIE